MATVQHEANAMNSPTVDNVLCSKKSGRWLLTAGFVLLALSLYAPRLNSDGAYYYEFIRSMAINGDLQFTDERDFFTYRYVPVFEDFLPGDWIDRGYAPNIFSLGPALSWSLPYFAVHGFATLLQRAGYISPVTGYELAYCSVPGFSSMLQGLAALLLLGLWLQEFYSKRDSTFTVIIILFASNLLAFVCMTPAFSHSLSFLCSLTFLYLWHKFPQRHSGWNAAAYGMAAGAMALARWQNVFMLILPLADLLHELATIRTSRILRDRLKPYLIMGATAGIILLPQFCTTYLLYGKPLTDPQGHGGMHWLTPWFKTILFDSNHGLFVINPVYLFGFIGLPLVWRRDRRLAIGLLAVLISQTWINAVRRDPFGVGFGMRRFINTLPMVSFGLCALLDAARRISWLRCGLIAVLVLLIPWNLLLMAQYYLTDLGAPWTHVPPRLIVERQLSLAPQLLLNLCQRGLLLSGLNSNTVSASSAVTLTLLLIAATVTVSFLFQRMIALPHDRLALFGKLCVLSALSFCIASAGWLLHSDARTTTLRAVELRKPDSLGTWKPYRRAQGAPYPGRISGLLFRGDQIFFDSAKAEYFRDKFIELGWYKTEQSFFLRRSNNWAVIPLRPPQRARAMELVTAISSDKVIPLGTAALEAEVLTGSSIERWPLRVGQHIGVSSTYPPQAAAASDDQCTKIWTWDRNGQLAARYSSIRTFDQPSEVKEIRIRSVTSDGDVHLFGVALLN